MRILAIDYGKKRTGIAWSDPLQIIAAPVGTVPTTELLQELKRMFEKEQIERIVLGYPTNTNGEATDATAAVEAFHKKLSQHFPKIPVTLWDERFTSSMAKQAMIDAGVPKMKRRNKGLIDRTSAVIMLQEFLQNDI